jgi:hypothetical protein
MSNQGILSILYIASTSKIKVEIDLVEYKALGFDPTGEVTTPDSCS